MKTVMRRREALAVLMGCAMTANTNTWASSHNHSSVKGCLIQVADLRALERSGAAFAQVSEQLVTTTGDQSLDKALGRALVRLADLFGERPGFGFFNDRDGPNAFASPETQVRGTWGTVLFGQVLFQDLMSRYQDQGFAVLAVAAHEFAHVAQFRSGVDRQLLHNQQTVKRVELHADFLSGYFLGFRKRQDPNIKVWAAGHTLYRIGDYHFNNRNHHGTPDERVAAAEAGFEMGNESDTAFGHAFSRGVEHILTNF